jgi:hypothetical protein
MARLKFTKHAHWYVTVTTAVGRRGQIRTAVIIVTPFERRFVEIDRSADPSHRIAAAAHVIATHLGQEPWFRRPDEIRAGDRELTVALTGLVDRVRTDATSLTLLSAIKEFERFARQAAAA